MTESDKVLERNPDWPVALLCLVFDMSEGEIPDTVNRETLEEDVAAAIIRAVQDNEITELQRDMMEAICGRYGPVQSLRGFSRSRGLVKQHSTISQMSSATSKFGKSRDLLRVAGIM